MDKVPPEIWMEIFTYACTDTGITGRSLSMVSRFFHEASRPVKLQNIAIHGHEQMIRFHDLLDHTTLHFRNVRSLLVSSWWQEEEEPPGWYWHEDWDRHEDEDDDEDLFWKEQEAEARRRYWKEKVKLERGYVLGALKSILENTAHSLKILELDCPACYYCGIGAAFPGYTKALVMLPQLTDLTIYTNQTFCMGDSSYLGYMHLLDSCVPRIDSCPALRRLHLVYPPIPLCFSFTHHFRSMAPNLTHLLISGVAENADVANGWPMDNLNLAPPPDTNLETLDTTKLPETIEKIIFEPRSPCRSHAPDNELLGAVQRLQVRDHRVVLLPTRSNGYSGGAAGKESDWVDRANGRGGCWALCD